MKKIILTTTLFYTALFFIQAQQLEQNQTGLNFGCVASPLIKFLGVGFSEVDHIQISRWENNFTPFSNGFGPVRDNFHQLDTERFYIEIQDLSTTSSQIFATLESLDENEALIDKQENIPLDFDPDLGLHRSDAKIVVADQNMHDDDFNMPTIPFDDGVNNQGNDVSIFAIPEGKLRVKYEYETPDIDGDGTPEIHTEEKLVDVCKESGVSEMKKVRLRLINMKDSNGNTFFMNSEILSFVDNAQSLWGQCCLKFVNQIGEAFTEGDVIKQDQPDGVDLSDGLNILNCVDLYATAEEQALYSDIKDDMPETVEVVFLNYVTEKNQDGAIVDMGQKGLSFPLFDTSGNPNVSYRYTVVVTSHRGYFTLAHEIGHLLIDKDHYTPNSSSPDYFYSEYDLPFNYNLMKNGTDENNGVLKSKRLVKKQCTESRNNKNLTF